jgi:Tfp pilus assembly ATPase PilU
MKRWELKKQQKLQALSENVGAIIAQKPKKVKENNEEETISDVITESDLHETDYYFEGGMHELR